MSKLTVLALLVFSLVAKASQLDLAAVQFPEVKTAGELEAALGKVNLARILSIRQISGKTTIATRGQATARETNYCSVIIGQITKESPAGQR